MSDEIIDLRCPAKSNSLLLKMRTDPDTARGVSVSNTLLIFCRACTQVERRKRKDNSFRIIHEFSVLGEHLSTFDERM